MPRRPPSFTKDTTLNWVIESFQNGVLVDLDSDPTVAVYKNGSTTPYTAETVTVTKIPSTTGQYSASFNPASEVYDDTFRFKELGTLSSVAYESESWYSRVVASESLLAAGTISTNAAVDPDTNEIRIIQGASYDGTAKPKLQWTVTKDYTGFTGELFINHRVTGATLLSGVTVTVVSSTLLEASLTTINTAFTGLTINADFGNHPYQIHMTSGSNVDIIGQDSDNEGYYAHIRQKLT